MTLFGEWTVKVKEGAKTEWKSSEEFVHFSWKSVIHVKSIQGNAMFNDPNLTYTAYIKCFVMLKSLSNISAIDVCVVRIQQKFE